MIFVSCYDQDPHETVYMLDKQRDEYELELVQRVSVTGKPVFESSWDTNGERCIGRYPCSAFTGCQR